MRRQNHAAVLVGPSLLFREGLARILSAADFRVVASVAHVQDAVPSLLSRHQSALLIIDTGDDPDGAVAQIELFKEQCPSGRVAVLTDHCNLSDMVSAFQAGANGYFVRLVNCDAFTKALELVMLGETILPPELLPFIGERQDVRAYSPALSASDGGEIALTSSGVDDIPRLSVREQSILRCIVEGDSNKAIARKINIAEATVKVHVKAILRKIRLHNRTQAAIWAMNNSSIIWPSDICALPALMAEAPPLLSEEPIGPPHVAGLIGGGIVELRAANDVVRKCVDRKKS